MEINTLYQLLAFQRANPELLAAADCLLMMPDFFHWCLCGSRVAEFTDATTSQCLNPVTRDWAFDLLKKFDLPERIFPKIVPPGTELGRLRQSVCERTGLGRSKSSLRRPMTPPRPSPPFPRPTPAKQTGRMSVQGPGRSWVSRRRMPCCPIASFSSIFTNEGGIDGTFRLLKNITGLWLVQQCKKAFEALGRNLDYAELARLAEESPATGAIIDPDDPRLANPPDMPAAIQSLCRENNQTAPETEGALVRCALESLAARYAQVLGGLEKVTGTGIDVIHVVGGGSRNQLLNQLTANRCRRRVVAGPAETTALGNLLSQVRAAGELKSLSEMREVVRAGSELTVFEPQKV